MRPSTVPSYLDCYAAQVGALGIAGQQRLQRASVAVFGAGGLGTAISTILATTGVGTLIIVDPQRVEAENFNRYSFARSRDLGRPKADVLASFFEGRPHLTVVPVVDRAENIQLMDIIKNVDLVVATANTVAARLAVARIAVRRRVAHISAALTDGREGLGGVVGAWVPERRDLACPACFLTPGAKPSRGESLLSPVVSVVGAMAACLAVQLLLWQRPDDALDGGNCLAIDLDRYAVELLRVRSRDDCPACTSVRGRMIKGRRHRR